MNTYFYAIISACTTMTPSFEDTGVHDYSWEWSCTEVPLQTTSINVKAVVTYPRVYATEMTLFDKHDLRIVNIPLNQMTEVDWQNTAQINDFKCDPDAKSKLTFEVVDE